MLNCVILLYEFPKVKFSHGLELQRRLSFLTLGVLSLVNSEEQQSCVCLQKTWQDLIHLVLLCLVLPRVRLSLPLVFLDDRVLIACLEKGPERDFVVFCSLDLSPSSQLPARGNAVQVGYSARLLYRVLLVSLLDGRRTSCQNEKMTIEWYILMLKSPFKV